MKGGVSYFYKIVRKDFINRLKDTCPAWLNMWQNI